MIFKATIVDDLEHLSALCLIVRQVNVLQSFNVVKALEWDHQIIFAESENIFESHPLFHGGSDGDLRSLADQWRLLAILDALEVSAHGYRVLHGLGGFLSLR